MTPEQRDRIRDLLLRSGTEDCEVLAREFEKVELPGYCRCCKRREGGRGRENAYCVECVTGSNRFNVTDCTHEAGS